MEQVASKLKDYGTVVIHGDPGAGKTQLALQYIQNHKDKYDSICYLDASSELVFVASLYRFYDFLTVARSNDDFHIGRASPNVSDFARRLCHAFSEKERLLMIFDEINQSHQEFLSDYVPRAPRKNGAHKIFVTRQISWYLKFYEEKCFYFCSTLDSERSAGLLKASAPFRKSGQNSSEETEYFKWTEAMVAEFRLHPAEVIILNKIRCHNSTLPASDKAPLCRFIPEIRSHVSSQQQPENDNTSASSQIWTAAWRILPDEAKNLLRVLVAMQTTLMSADL